MKLKKKDVFEALKNDYKLFYKPMPEEWKTLFPVFTIDDAEKCGLHFTTNHTGKMAGMQSLSTTCKCGSLCPNRIRAAFESVGIDPENSPKKALREILKKDPFRNDISICGFCFSDSQQDYQSNMVPALARNYEILNGGIIHPDWIPTVNTLYFRGESFGDFASVNAVVNFWNLAKKNSSVNFTAWTKNAGFFYKAIKAGHKKPANFKIVLSSQFINKPATIPESWAEFVDAVFTVYTPEYAKKYGIGINCGARACLACLKCYRAYKKGQVKEINELLK